MNYCPCCSNLLLLHINGSDLYWFCRHCWQKMPVFLGHQSCLLSEHVVEELPTIVDRHHESEGLVCTNKRETINGWIGLDRISI